MRKRQRSYFGIDFGTTNTAVVYLLVDEYGVKITNCSEDNMPFSSLLAIHKKNGTILFGRQVKIKRHQLSQDYYIFSSFKSMLGKDESFLIAGKKYTPTNITSIFLMSIKKYVKANMNLDINEAVIAIPNDYTPIQRKELKIAAEAAGIKVNKFISESTAAYIHDMNSLKGLSKVAVFDWGGGTLDISILEVEKNILKELATYGAKLGGDDIDKILAKKIHANIVSNSSIGNYDDMPNRDKDHIIEKCENAKIKLSDEDYDKFQLIDYGLPGVVRITLEYKEFEEIIRPQVEKALKILFEAVEKAGISVAQLDAIIMAGAVAK